MPGRRPAALNDPRAGLIAVRKPTGSAGGRRQQNCQLRVAANQKSQRSRPAPIADPFAPLPPAPTTLCYLLLSARRRLPSLTPKALAVRRELRVLSAMGSRRGDMSRLSRSWNGSLVPRPGDRRPPPPRNRPLTCDVPGAGERIRTTDLPFTRSPAPCIDRASCTDDTGNRTDGTHRAGII
jgi:hypothetical protein